MADQEPQRGPEGPEGPGDHGGSFETRSADETRRVGRAIGAAAQPATLVALVGPLGAGKTQLAKGIAEGLGVRGVVNSPTFILMNEHAGRVPLFHVDAYRLDDPDEAFAAGLFDERQAGGVTVIEWADRLAAWLPADRLEIVLAPAAGQPTTRLIRWRALGERAAALAHRALRSPFRDSQPGEVAAAS